MDYKHILAATDFSDLSKQACIKAAKLARFLDAHLTILHVIEHFPEDRSEDAIPPENIDPQTFFIEQAEKEMAATREALDFADTSADIVLTGDSACKEIVKYAEKHGVDLIVTGTHGVQGMLEKLGSTANSIFHDAKVDILIVRANE